MKAYRRILARNPEPCKVIQLQERELQTIPSYRRALYIAHKPRLPRRALTARSAAEVRETEAKFKRESVAVVDDFLTPEVLAMLHDLASLPTIYKREAIGILGFSMGWSIQHTVALSGDRGLASTFPQYI